MKKIKCNFKNITENEKNKLKNASCLLTISVGQESHENERFCATMNLINDTFRSCTITLHDSLQRYTIALNQQHDANYFHDVAASVGDRWLARNEKYYKNSSNSLNIVRWDEWLADPEFLKHKKQIIATMHIDPSYKIAFNSTINEYLSRYTRRLQEPSAFNYERAYQLCFDYLVEECAVLCVWPKSGCHYELYAGKHNAAMEETRKRFVHPTYPNLVQSVIIGFNYRPDLKPQCFNNHQNTEARTISE